MLHLHKFIDGYEYPMLSTHTIHIIAKPSPMTSNPSQCIPFHSNSTLSFFTIQQYIHNATIQTAAVSALWKLAVQCSSLHTSILAMLNHYLIDKDDETPDRASIEVSILKEMMA